MKTKASGGYTSTISRSSEVDSGRLLFIFIEKKWKFSTLDAVCTPPLFQRLRWKRHSIIPDGFSIMPILLTSTYLYLERAGVSTLYYPSLVGKGGNHHSNRMVFSMLSHKAGGYTNFRING
jgi:hypothetical protein